MSRGRAEVLERRARLIERAAVERDELARLAGAWAGPIGAVDRGVSVVRAVARSPVVRMGVAVGMAALAFVRPRAIGGWVHTGLNVARTVSSLMGALRR